MKKFPYTRFTWVVNIFVFCVCVLVICGYIFRVEVLMSTSPTLSAMNPATAILLMLCCCWLAVYLRKHVIKSSPYILKGLGLFVLLCGIEKLLEYGGIGHVYYDRWLFWDILKERPNHNPVAHNAAVLFCITGLVMLNAPRKSNTARLISDALRLAGFITAYFSLLGYVYRFPVAYTVGPLAPMALNTSICFALLFFNLFLCLPKGPFSAVIGSPYLGGIISRRGVPLLLVVPLLFGYFRHLGVKTGLYDAEYGIALYTVFVVLVMFILLYIYSSNLNRKDLSDKNGQLRIAESEEKYRTLFEKMGEGAMYLDKNGIVRFCNPALCEITGWDMQALVTQSLARILADADDLKLFIDEVNNPNEKRHKGWEIQLKHKNGQLIWGYVTKSVLFDARGNATALFCTLIDITERKKQAEDLEVFTFSAAHELSAPLARMEMIAEMLVNNTAGQVGGEAQMLITAAAKTSAEMRRMLGGLLQFSKLGSGQVVKTEVDVNQLVQTIVEDNKYLNPAAQVAVEMLPKAWADEQALSHVLTNLITNALKYSSRVQQPWVQVGYLEDKGKKVYFVKDNGVGFDMQKAAKLFVPFHRFHTHFDGNGLGLPIAKRIIEKHGGRIWAEGEPGKGAVFYFTLQ